LVLAAGTLVVQFGMMAPRQRAIEARLAELQQVQRQATAEDKVGDVRTVIRYGPDGTPTAHVVTLAQAGITYTLGAGGSDPSCQVHRTQPPDPQVAGQMALPAEAGWFVTTPATVVTTTHTGTLTSEGGPVTLTWGRSGE